MFDFHMHSRVSFDSEAEPLAMVRAAEERGLRAICFTDHYDHHEHKEEAHDLFTLADYAAAYDGLHSERVKVLRGVEVSLVDWNREELDLFLSSRPFDFVIGSVHYAGGHDPYYPAFWEGKTAEGAFALYMEQTLNMVKTHDNFDVLGHINYVCKSAHNPTHAPLRYADYREISDEIMRILVKKGKGMEINTSGVDRVGDFLPSRDFLERFRALGGEIVTLGSDAHDPSRVGQYATEALAILKDVFGYVCTFENRKAVFHRL